ncbi:uncharacterized protein MONOS_360 [Monocercomonoides exilis]|uniref:uncharacterized protein n=1 Tax=Monocercomonoides exilis TaxID=2049356 RepID=UPI003559EA5A|nr:hypothetical protein MONOS_360 [Monocercomonoides exilis]|eukprot:MONOS_360.1-p1 / transcript=MONOS_360.1 / gene=MONOS_360 / organism=Monocercomonoides_exilis_PA203 / gene_product=unspecified product / transcript_product=unspecified product / location=Mono_scaffold00006:37834-42951(+) / protein_length=1706 / sequence_SO=supercontig / SO=protein_coding / is_pseudo=false
MQNCAFSSSSINLQTESLQHSVSSFDSSKKLENNTDETSSDQSASLSSLINLVKSSSQHPSNISVTIPEHTVYSDLQCFIDAFIIALVGVNSYNSVISDQMQSNVILFPVSSGMVTVCNCVIEHKNDDITLPMFLLSSSFGVQEYSRQVFCPGKINLTKVSFLSSCPLYANVIAADVGTIILNSLRVINSNRYFSFIGFYKFEDLRVPSRNMQSDTSFERTRSESQQFVRTLDISNSMFTSSSSLSSEPVCVSFTDSQFHFPIPSRNFISNKEFNEFTQIPANITFTNNTMTLISASNSIFGGAFRFLLKSDQDSVLVTNSSFLMCSCSLNDEISETTNTYGRGGVFFIDLSSAPFNPDITPIAFLGISSLKKLNRGKYKAMQRTPISFLFENDTFSNNNAVYGRDIYLLLDSLNEDTMLMYFQLDFSNPYYSFNNSIYFTAIDDGENDVDLLPLIFFYTSNEIAISKCGEDSSICGKKELPCITVKHAISHLSADASRQISVIDSISIDEEIILQSLTCSSSRSAQVATCYFNETVQNSGMNSIVECVDIVCIQRVAVYINVSVGLMHNCLFFSNNGDLTFRSVIMAEMPRQAKSCNSANMETGTKLPIFISCENGRIHLQRMYLSLSPQTRLLHFTECESVEMNEVIFGEKINDTTSSWIIGDEPAHQEPSYDNHNNNKIYHSRYEPEFSLNPKTFLSHDIETEEGSFVQIEKCFFVCISDSVFNGIYQASTVASSNEKQNTEFETSNKPANIGICHSKGSLISCHLCSVNILNTTIKNSQVGGLTLVGSNTSISNCIFANNSKNSDAYPSASCNIKCKKLNDTMSTLNVQSLQYLNGTFLPDDPEDSLWIRNKGCTLDGIPKERYSSFFVPKLDSVEVSLNESNLCLHCLGNLFIPCFLTIDIVRKTNYSEGYDNYEIMKEGFINENKLIAQIPVSAIQSFTPNTTTFIRLRYGEFDLPKRTTETVQVNLLPFLPSSPKQEVPGDDHRDASYHNLIIIVIVMSSTIFVCLIFLVIFIILYVKFKRKQKKNRTIELITEEDAQEALPSKNVQSQVLMDTLICSPSDFETISANSSTIIDATNENNNEIRSQSSGETLDCNFLECNDKNSIFDFAKNSHEQCNSKQNDQASHFDGRVAENSDNQAIDENNSIEKDEANKTQQTKEELKITNVDNDEGEDYEEEEEEEYEEEEEEEEEEEYFEDNPQFLEKISKFKDDDKIEEIEKTFDSNNSQNNTLLVTKSFKKKPSFTYDDSTLNSKISNRIKSAKEQEHIQMLLSSQVSCISSQSLPRQFSQLPLSNLHGQTFTEDHHPFQNVASHPQLIHSKSFSSKGQLSVDNHDSCNHSGGESEREENKVNRKLTSSASEPSLPTDHRSSSKEYKSSSKGKKSSSKDKEHSASAIDRCQIIDDDVTDEPSDMELSPFMMLPPIPQLPRLQMGTQPIKSGRATSVSSLSYLLSKIDSKVKSRTFDAESQDEAHSFESFHSQNSTFRGSVQEPFASSLSALPRMEKPISLRVRECDIESKTLSNLPVFFDPGEKNEMMPKKSYKNKKKDERESKMTNRTTSSSSSRLSSSYNRPYSSTISGSITNCLTRSSSQSHTSSIIHPPNATSSFTFSTLGGTARTSLMGEVPQTNTSISIAPTDRSPSPAASLHSFNTCSISNSDSCFSFSKNFSCDTLVKQSTPCEVISEQCLDDDAQPLPTDE